MVFVPSSSYHLVCAVILIALQLRLHVELWTRLARHCQTLTAPEGFKLSIACALMGTGAPPSGDASAVMKAAVVPVTASQARKQWMGACYLALGDGVAGLVDPTKCDGGAARNRSIILLCYYCSRDACAHECSRGGVTKVVT